MKYKLLDRRAAALLRKVIKVIETTPKAYAQNRDDPVAEPSCDSPQCVLGWFRHFAKMKHLDLGLLTGQQQERLYWATQWPGRYYRDFNRDVTPRLAVGRIKLFLATDGQK